MFIWDWVSIAFGWLVFLFLLSIIVSYVKQIIRDLKRRF